MDLTGLRFANFSEYQRGILVQMLLDAYQAATELVERHKKSWLEFDNFVFDNLGIMDKNGFVMVKDGKPVGFASWDPRNLPESVEIGHNCVNIEYQGFGFGIVQLDEVVRRIKERNPKVILVKTGNIPFFLPARRMYESSGFAIVAITNQDDPSVTEVVEYVLRLI